MKHLLVCLVLTLLAGLGPTQAAENLFKDGGVAEFTEANRTFAKVTALIGEAKAKGIDVLYWQAAVIPMRVRLNERWKSFPEERPDTLRYVAQRGQELIQEINRALAGELKPQQVPPKPDFTRMKLKGRNVETLTEEVNDFCLNESPASTKYVDFLRSLSGNRKAIVEIEGSEYRNTMASFLHGLSALSLYWAWSDKPGDGGAFLYGRGSRPPYCTLPEAERFLRTGLDIRRLRQEILAFQQDIQAPVALLYSKASLLQVPAVGGDKTPCAT